MSYYFPFIIKNVTYTKLISVAWQQTYVLFHEINLLWHCNRNTTSTKQQSINNNKKEKKLRQILTLHLAKLFAFLSGKTFSRN